MQNDHTHHFSKAKIIRRVILFTLLSAMLVSGVFLSMKLKPHPVVSWLLKNGTLNSTGTATIYEEKESNGNIFRISYTEYESPNLVAYLYQKTTNGFIIETQIPLNTNGYISFDRVTCRCVATDSSGAMRGVSFGYHPYKFTQNTHIQLQGVVGDPLYMTRTNGELHAFSSPDGKDVDLEQKYSSMRKITEELAHKNICYILDWLQFSICHEAGCSLFDLGYYKFK